MNASEPLKQPLSLYDRRVERIAAGAEVTAGPCPVCGDARARPTYRVDGVASPIVVCAACGLGRFHPMLSPGEIESFYPEEYYGPPGTKFRPQIERIVRAVAARHIAFLSRGLAPGARILDVGCGRGGRFGPLADRGFAVAGVEMSEHATRGCDPRAEVRIAKQLSAADFEAASFDQVVIWHVLEHLPDPIGTIRECHRILKPGGRLIVAVPNLSSFQARFAGPHWFHLDPPRHLYHFPYEALRRMLEEAKFEIASSHHFSLRQNPFGWIQSALNRWSRQPVDALYTLLHQHSAGTTVTFPLRTRAFLFGVLVSSAPIALALSVLAAGLRSGATVHVVALRR